MTFNQWAARSKFDGLMRFPLEEVWNALIAGGKSGDQAAILLTDLVDAIPEYEPNEMEDMF